MSNLLNILSKIYCILLHPILIPSYGVAGFCCAIKNILPELPRQYILLCIIGTIVLTLIIPAILLLFMWRKGYIDSLHISKANQRTAPYIYTLICYSFWAYFLHFTMHLPILVLGIALGVIGVLLIVAIINLKWKISAHLAGLGGLLGGVCSFAIYYATLPMGLIIAILILALLLMYARIYLNAHTPSQVVCGFLLGLIGTFTPTLILTYA